MKQKRIRRQFTLARKIIIEIDEEDAEEVFDSIRRLADLLEDLDTEKLQDLIKEEKL